MDLVMLPGSWAINSGFWDLNSGICCSKLEQSMACSLFFLAKVFKLWIYFNLNRCVPRESWIITDHLRQLNTWHLGVSWFVYLITYLGLDAMSVIAYACFEVCSWCLLDIRATYALLRINNKNVMLPVIRFFWTGYVCP